MKKDKAKILVTVLMPVYNAASYIKEAVESVLNQTYSDFELLIINDGSSDASIEIIKSFEDSRIRIQENEKNLGLIKTLNLGIKNISTKYIVRADADDICLPTRIEEQVEFMENNPMIGLSGTWFNNFDENGQQGGARYSSTDFDIRMKHLYQIHISHGTLIVRTSLLHNLNLTFDTEYAHAEDYDLFDRAGVYHQFGNIQKVLYLVRQHDRNISKLNASIQNENSDKVKQRIFMRLGVSVGKNELKLYRDLEHQCYNKLLHRKTDVLQLLNDMFTANEKSLTFSSFLFRNHLCAMWFNYCNSNASRKFNGYKWFKKGMFTSNYTVSMIELLKLKTKEFIR